ncbi:MAG: GHKL domain-containing protein [Clostridiales Family XIII bacterium]|jgi:hypothetical protein|nr:GHKL domain-containing protein [Clostridiales Family XIII bacterium]
MNALISEIPRIYTALAEWGACMVYISMLPPRVSRKKLIVCAPAALLAQIAFMASTGKLPIPFWIPCMMVAILLMFGFLYFTCQSNAANIASTCARAFILAELTASLERQIYWFFFPGDDASFIVKAVLLAGIYGSIFFLARLLEHRHIADTRKLDISGRELTGVILVVTGVFIISNISFVTGNTPFSSSYPWEIVMFRTLADAGGYVILYAHYVLCCQARIRKELESTYYILQTQYAQYKHSRESIDLFNRKYHDLKHQISVLRAEKDPEKQQVWLDAIEGDIRDYEAQNKTGNSVLDTILTGKGLYCNKHGISLTCVADGALLEFMDVRDICTVFGNALDNAIESVMRIPEKEKRLIHVSVFKQKGFAMFRFENYYEGELRYEDGLPVTTKENIDYHGYGLKSIRSVADRYGGTASVHARDHWFELDVFIPMEGIPSRGQS